MSYLAVVRGVAAVAEAPAVAREGADAEAAPGAASARRNACKVSAPAKPSTASPWLAWNDRMRARSALSMVPGGVAGIGVPSSVANCRTN